MRKTMKRKIDVTANAVWTKDCCGKQDLDFDMISCDTRYYPDFSAICNITFRPEFNAYLGDYVSKEMEYMLAQSEVMHSTSEKAIKAKVRRWYNRNMVIALKRAIKFLEEGYVDLTLK